MLHFPKWKIVLVLAICFLGIAYATPNLLDRSVTEKLPSWLPNQQINLGLDLQGGAHLLLEVDVNAVTRERMESVLDLTRLELRKARIGYTGLGVEGNAVVLQPTETGQVAEINRLLNAADSDLAVEAGEGGRVTIRVNEAALEARKRAAVEQSIEIVRRRIDETGTREPTIQRQGEDRILVQLPGIDDPERIKALLGQTAKMVFRLVDSRNSLNDAMAGRLPPGSQLLPSDQVGPNGQPQQMYLVERRVMVSGDTLVDAQPSFNNGEPVVSFRFDSVGARRFGDVTATNVGQPFAIVLDDKVISAPVIREPILGGSGQISGNFTVQEAQDLALLLRAGALPAPLTVLEERTVGPGLGADSIAAGEIAAVLGMLAVVVFMVVAYGLFGIIANVALVINLVLIIAALSVLQATLTLPGIAGIVLTIGMAVDANVLVFERIREESKNGRPPVSAIDAGYNRAISTIIDANLTTFIAALLLYIFGSGPIRGFAVTLSIGLLTSMFTAIMVTRLIVVVWLRRSRPKTLPI
ncbi:MAG: protein translocase subunit SecD [Alphaproteobacteria bacterium]|nr:protein translocase subunit SecD [Alphaproteobacteria bacterium]MBU0797100.1 protein translocase subunit SecD [Alphaproteobacteria bacterium]MBU0887907.1 protein translocase subunit SecD [Alphaproteobacteria bacterium]MBU1814870.1 protein translocase subunit SecD [Alphaproteobacteria bacterium]MBU2090936.1 protein translocase subunit SecD [Alphaproteobacteria bacterium]